MNPNDEQAKLKFQQVADAYEILSNADKRRAYDANPDAHKQHQSSAGQQQQQQRAHDTWAQATSDTTIIKEALREFGIELQEDLSEVAAAVAKGDYSKIWDFAKRRRALVISVALPLVALLRFPGPILAALRVVPTVLLGGMTVLVRMKLGGFAFRVLWAMTVTAAQYSRQVTRQHRAARLQAQRKKSSQRKRGTRR